MRTIERRVSALEAKTSLNNVEPVYVWRESDETQADALSRAGVPLLESGHFVMISWQDEKP